MRIIVAGPFGRILVQSYLFLVAGDLIFELASALPRSTECVCLAIKSFVAMTTQTAALVEKIAAQIQRVGSLSNAVSGMALLTSGLSVLLLKHRPEPELVAAVTFHVARRRAAIAPVATRATKPIGRMYLQYLFVGMTHERARPTVGLLARTIRRQIFRPQVERFANPCVANFAAVDDVEFINTDLVRQNGIVKLIHLVDEPVDLSRTQAGHVVLQIIVALLSEFRRFLEQVSLLAEQSRLFLARIVEQFLKLLIVKLLGCRFLRTVGGRQINFDRLRSLFLSLFAIFVFGAAGSDLDVVVDDCEFAPLVLKGLGNSIESLLSQYYFFFNLSDVRFHFFLCCLGIRIQRLVFRILFNLRLSLTRLRLDTLQVSGVTTDKLLLHPFPGTLSEGFIVERPGERGGKQQCADQHDATRRAAHDWILRRQLRLFSHQRFVSFSRLRH